MTLKAIETIYNGYKFRSRLEARWAVFFDTLGVEYQYELEGFDLDGLWYLPDFHVKHPFYFFGTQGIAWVEIKPLLPTPEEIEKAERLADQSASSTLVLWGEIDPEKGKGGNILFSFEQCNCPDCTKLHSVSRISESWFFDSTHYLPLALRLRDSGDISTQQAKDYIDALDRAVLAARQARFEHGQNG